MSDRGLADVETSWSYTVFLQSVIHYLSLKEQIGQTSDASYGYAKGTFVNYAQWMLDNEYPYLDKPGIHDFSYRISPR